MLDTWNFPTGEQHAIVSVFDSWMNELIRNKALTNDEQKSILALKDMFDVFINSSTKDSIVSVMKKHIALIPDIWAYNKEFADARAQRLMAALGCSFRRLKWELHKSKRYTLSKKFLTILCAIVKDEKHLFLQDWIANQGLWMSSLVHEKSEAAQRTLSHSHTDTPVVPLNK